MFQTLKNNKTFRVIVFLLSFFALYIFWYYAYHAEINFIKKIDRLVLDSIVNNSKRVLIWLGYALIDFSKFDHENRALGIDGSNGVYIGDPCNGLSLFVLYTIFMITYPGNILSKVIFIPLGILIIHVLNIFRVVSLSLISFYSPAYLEFNHTYTFTIFIYGVIFLLWYFWIKKYTGDKSTNR